VAVLGCCCFHSKIKKMSASRPYEEDEISVISRVSRGDATVLKRAGEEERPSGIDIKKFLLHLREDTDQLSGTVDSSYIREFHYFKEHLSAGQRLNGTAANEEVKRITQGLKQMDTRATSGTCRIVNNSDMDALVVGRHILQRVYSIFRYVGDFFVVHFMNDITEDLRLHDVFKLAAASLIRERSKLEDELRLIPSFPSEEDYLKKRGITEYQVEINALNYKWAIQLDFIRKCNEWQASNTSQGTVDDDADTIPEIFATDFATRRYVLPPKDVYEPWLEAYEANKHDDKWAVTTQMAAVAFAKNEEHSNLQKKILSTLECAISRFRETWLMEYAVLKDENIVKQAVLQRKIKSLPTEEDIGAYVQAMWAGATSISHIIQEKILTMVEGITDNYNVLPIVTSTIINLMDDSLITELHPRGKIERAWSTGEGSKIVLAMYLQFHRSSYVNFWQQFNLDMSRVPVVGENDLSVLLTELQDMLRDWRDHEYWKFCTFDLLIFFLTVRRLPEKQMKKAFKKLTEHQRALVISPEEHISDQNVPLCTWLKEELEMTVRSQRSTVKLKGVGKRPIVVKPASMTPDQLSAATTVSSISTASKSFATVDTSGLHQAQSVEVDPFCVYTATSSMPKSNKIKPNGQRKTGFVSYDDRIMVSMVNDPTRMVSYTCTSAPCQVCKDAMKSGIPSNHKPACFIGSCAKCSNFGHSKIYCMFC